MVEVVIVCTLARQTNPCQEKALADLAASAWARGWRGSRTATSGSMWSKCNDSKANVLSWGVVMTRCITARSRRPTIPIESFHVFPCKLFPAVH